MTSEALLDLRLTGFCGGRLPRTERAAPDRGRPSVPCIAGANNEYDGGSIVTPPLKITEPEEPDLFRFRRPTAVERRMFVLSMTVAADLAGVIPRGPAAGWSIGLTAAATLIAGCIRRGQ